jgi:hypothetical protein
MKSTQLLLIAAVVVMAVARTAGAQSSRPERPLPNGPEIDVRDGDRVIIEGDARVRVITRYRGFVRALYNPQEHWLILMIDSSSPDTGAPDGAPDVSFSYNGLEGEWPLGDRWESYATVDLYTLPGQFRTAGVAIATPEGLVQIFPYSPVPAPATATNLFRDASARAVLTHQGFGTGSTGGHATFDQLEEGLIASAKRNAQMQAQNPRPNMSWSATGGQNLSGVVRLEKSWMHLPRIPMRPGRRA